MPKTKDSGFLLDDSDLSPYKVNKSVCEENPANNNEDQKDDKSKRGS